MSQDNKLQKINYNRTLREYITIYLIPVNHATFKYKIAQYLMVQSVPRSNDSPFRDPPRVPISIAPPLSVPRRPPAFPGDSRNSCEELIE